MKKFKLVTTGFFSAAGWVLVACGQWVPAVCCFCAAAAWQMAPAGR